MCIKVKTDTCKIVARFLDANFEVSNESSCGISYYDSRWVNALMRPVNMLKVRIAKHIAFVRLGAQLAAYGYNADKMTEDKIHYDVFMIDSDGAIVYEKHV